MLLSLTLVIALPSPAHAEEGATSLTLESEPGDLIGGGIDRSFSPADGSFGATGGAGLVSVLFNGGPERFSLDFKAPNGVDMTPGPYEGATRYPFQSPTTPGLDVWGNGRRCNTSTGRFDVLEAVFALDGTVDVFPPTSNSTAKGPPRATGQHPLQRLGQLPSTTKRTLWWPRSHDRRNRERRHPLGHSRQRRHRGPPGR